MSPHNCPGLNRCHEHPRVHVWRGGANGRWYVDSPVAYFAHSMPTHEVAVTAATRHARDLALVAVESQPGATA